MDSGDFGSLQLITEEEVMEEYYIMLKRMHEAAAAADEDNKTLFKDNLLKDDLTRKDKFVLANHIPEHMQALIEYLILLEWHVEQKQPPVPQAAIYGGILRLERALAKVSLWELVGLCEDEDDDYCKGPLNSVTNFGINLMETTICQYVTDVLDFKEGNENALFFSSTNDLESDVIVKWRILEKIATVKVVSDQVLYHLKLKELLKMRVNHELKRYLKPKLSGLKLEGKGTVLENIKLLIDILENLKSQLSETGEMYHLFTSLFDSTRLNYWDLVAEAVEKLIYPVCETSVALLDKYHIAYKEFHVNLRDSCILCHSLYTRVKAVVQWLDSRVKNKASCGQLHELSKIFKNCFLNVLQVIEVECHSRIKRATESDQDSMVEDKGIMSSTVIVLTCLCTVIDEWERLEIDEEEIQIAFLVKVTDALCDGAKIFSEAMANKANCLSADAKHADNVIKVCFCSNSVHHLLEFMKKLPQMMQWEEALSQLQEESNATDNPIEKVLSLILSTMQSHLENVIESINKVLILKIRNQCSKYLESWFQSNLRPTRGQYQSMERFTALLHEELGLVYEHLKESIFHIFLRSLWMYFLEFAEANFNVGKHPDYAQKITKNMEELHKYFVDMKLEETTESRKLCHRVMNTLDLNSRTTAELELRYFAHFADLLTSPEEYLGHLALQAGYRKIGRGTVDVTIKVRKLQKIPLKKFDITELTVKLELRPKVIFPSVQTVKTQAVTEELENPVFEDTFVFSALPISVLSVDGAVIQAIALNQDGSFCAEALLRLNRVQNMSCIKSIDFIPVHLVALRELDDKHVIFKIIEQRKKKDKLAKRFVSRKKEAVKSQNHLLSFIGCSSAHSKTSTKNQNRTLKSFFK